MDNDAADKLNQFYQLCHKLPWKMLNLTVEDIINKDADELNKHFKRRWIPKNCREAVNNSQGADLNIVQEATTLMHNGTKAFELLLELKEQHPDFLGWCNEHFPGTTEPANVEQLRDILNGFQPNHSVAEEQKQNQQERAAETQQTLAITDTDEIKTEEQTTSQENHEYLLLLSEASNFDEYDDSARKNLTQLIKQNQRAYSQLEPNQKHNILIQLMSKYSHIAGQENDSWFTINLHIGYLKTRKLASVDASAAVISKNPNISFFTREGRSTLQSQLSKEDIAPLKQGLLGKMFKSLG